MTAKSISPYGPDARRVRRHRKLAGTTLVELLVVIVVLLIGILAVIQIFPSGLRILDLNRRSVIAAALMHDEVQRLIGRSEQQPERIIPIIPQNNNSGNYDEAADRSLGDFGPIAGSIDPAGHIFDGSGDDLGKWNRLAGANIFRRIVGEGGQVPAPRQVGNFFGGLMVLQFTPIAYFEPPDPTDPSQPPGAFEVYGADMVRKQGPPQPGDAPQRFEYYVQNIDNANAALILPADAFATREYRLAMSFYVTVGANTRKKDVVNVTLVVAPTTGGGFYTLQLATGDAQNMTSKWLAAGETFQGAELESVRVARQYDLIKNLADPFTDPYQYKVLNQDYGVLLFSDQAFNAYELKNGRRVPLQARVNYDVYDWRVIRDEFRVPEGDVPQVKLALGSLKIKKMRDTDSTVYQGLDAKVPKSDGTKEVRDLALMDMDSGGFYLEANNAGQQLIRVDRSVGLLTFLDEDGNPANGSQAELMYPGATAPASVNVTGRAIRAMYQSRGEWAVQVTKAPSLFTQSTLQPGEAEFYVGGSDGTFGGSPTRIYFRQCQAGNRITIDQVWYKHSTDTVPRAMENQSFVIQSQPADPIGLAYVDIKSIDSDAQPFDYDYYGYAVKGVRGATMRVRVMWNPTNLSFTTDVAKNQTALDVWGREWRLSQTESYVRRPSE